MNTFWEEKRVGTSFALKHSGNATVYELKSLSMEGAMTCAHSIGHGSLID